MTKKEEFDAFLVEAHKQAQVIGDKYHDKAVAFLREHPEANAVLTEKDGSLHALKFVSIA